MDDDLGLAAARAVERVSPVDAALHARAKALFLEALAVAPAGRASFVAARAGGDAELTREVVSLLSHHVESPLLAGDRTAPCSAPPSMEVRKLAPQTRDPLGIAGVVLDARYRVEHLVGEGGFSYVYRAEHLLWRRPVALKLFKELDPAVNHRGLRESFVQEGALLNELSRRTSAIVHSYDVGLWTGASGASLLFTVLEWLEGETLAGLLQRERGASAWGWPLERVVATLDAIAEALAIAHERGIAHRDVKPSNVFLAGAGQERAAKLIDFGVAKVAVPHKGGFESTAPVAGAFTMAYAAPEQLQRSLGPTGPWTDVYALALVCVELLLGRHPSRAQTLADARGARVRPEQAPYAALVRPQGPRRRGGRARARAPRRPQAALPRRATVLGRAPGHAPEPILRRGPRSRRRAPATPRRRRRRPSDGAP